MASDETLGAEKTPTSASGGWAETHARSLRDPAAFWDEAAQIIDWSKPYSEVLDAANPPFYRWFVGGELNTCYNAVDRHVAAGLGDQIAIIYDSPITGQQASISYFQLQDKVSKAAGMLAELGVEKGDRVIIYMPMIAETLVGMLACARLGAIHSVVFGGFAANELAVRIDDAQPKVILSASCGIEPGRVVAYKPLLDEAIALSSFKPEHCVIVQRPQLRADLVSGRDADWDDLVAKAQPADCVPVLATDPLYILYTSGTTGQPKGVVRDNGGHAVALAWSMRNIYGVEPGDIYWAASDVGWVVGHSYILYGPLLNGNTTIVFEGKPVGTPDAGVFWRVIEEHKVSTLFTAPTALRAIKKEDPAGKLIADYDISSLRNLFLAGERTDPDSLTWAQEKLNVPVLDHWWQTETGWQICGNCIGIERLPIKAGSATCPSPGYDVQVLSAGGEPVDRGQIGALVVKLPLPPGTFPTLWNAERRYVDTYMSEFPGYYKTADAGYIDDDGYVFVMARTDDIINVAGHRLSTGAMEEVLAAHPDVAECAVIGVEDTLKGQVPLGLLVLNAGINRPDDEIVRESVQMVRERIGPVAAFKTATVVKRLPKTRSGKILRGTMQSIADQKAWNMPATIDDPSILEEISQALTDLGYAQGRD